MLNLSLNRQTLHFRKPAATSRGLLHTRTLWIVKAWDDREPEVVGIGECGPIPALSPDDRPDFEDAAEATLSQVSASRLPLRPGMGCVHVAQLLEPFSAALSRLASLRFGLETALMDLAAGGKGILWPSPFTRGTHPLPTHGLIWMDSAEGILEQVANKVASGFTVIKMKVGAQDWQAELELLRELRARYPQVELRLDANGAFAPSNALDRLQQLESLRIHFLEQPLPAGQRAATAWLCQNSPIPIALDEEVIGVDSDHGHDLLDEIRPAHLIVKPALLGGFSASARWISACRTLGIQWWANSLLESSIGHNAICQWVAAEGEGRVHGLGTGSLFTDNFPTRIGLAGSVLGYDSGSIVH